MARAPKNFYHSASPVAAIGSGLARAIFGDPAAAQEQARVRAEMDARAAQAERDRAAATYDTSRTAGQNTANAAQGGLPDLAGEWLRSQQPPPPAPGLNSPEFANYDTPLPMPEPQPDPTATLAALIGAMGQMQGDKIDPRHIMGTAGAFGGGDELARHGMIAQGQTPGEEFALTAERADDIAQQGYASELAKALGVAQINNRDDIPVANINAGARRDVAGINAGADRGVAGIGAAAKSKAAKSEKAPPRVSDGTTKALRNELEKLLPGFAPIDSTGDEGEPTIGTPAARAFLLSRAIEIYQRTGNLVGAAREAIRSNAAEAKDRREREARAAPGPANKASSAFISRQSGAARGISVKEAAKLPPGTKFVGLDGVERVRQ